MSFDLSAFRSELEAVTRAAVADLFARVPPAEISAIALFSDESVMTMCMAMNTFDHLASMTTDDPEYATYFRWSPGEWADEQVGANEFHRVTRRLADAVEHIPDESFDEHADAVYGAAIAVLEQLRSEGSFDALDPRCILTFAVSDFNDLEMETDAVRRLNTDEDAQEFAAWLESEVAR